MWGRVAFALAPSWCFSREAGYIAANHPMPIKQARKSLHQALTNNFAQSLITKYHHTATESLCQLCSAKIR